MAMWRSVAMAFMPQLVRYGFAANEALKELRRMGYGYRRQQMLRDYREVAGKAKLEDTVRSLPGDVRPGRDAMIEVELRQPERDYRVFGKVDIYDFEQREWISKEISFYDDTLRTKDDWTAEFIKQFGVYYAKYGQSVQSMEIHSIEHNKGHLY